MAVDRSDKSQEWDTGNALVHVEDGFISNMDFWLQHAIDVIKGTYGDEVSIYQKNKDLLKFGQSTQVGTGKSTLYEAPTGIINETYQTSNTIDYVSSSDAGDTTSLRVEGHTIDGSGNLTFVVQFVTLTGQTKVALTTPLARCTRLANAGAVDFVGNIYAFRDTTVTAGVPQTAANVHCMITAGNNNSSKASTSVSSIDYWVITNWHGLWLEKAAGWAEVHLEVREQGGVFIERDHVSVNGNTTMAPVELGPYIIVPKNSDVRLRATADGASSHVGGSINGILLKVRT